MNMGFYYDNRGNHIFIDFCDNDNCHLHGYTLVDIAANGDGMWLLPVGEYVPHPIVDIDTRDRIKVTGVDEI